MVSYLGNGITFPVADAGDIKASGLAFPIVGFVLILLRALSHRLKKTGAGLADAFGLISWLIIVGMGAIFVWSADHGALGWATPTNEPPLTMTHITEYQKRVLQSEYFFCILMVLALGTTKLSLLFFFRQIFVGHRRTFCDYFTRALIAVVAIWTIAFFLAFALECGGHPSAFWKPLDIRVQHCLAINGGIAAFEKACGISDLVLDVVCLVLPFPIVWQLKLRLSYKLSITGILAVGLMTIAASVARLVIWVEVLNTASHPTEDVNLAVAMSLQWGMIEAGLAFIASQLPALGTYLSKVTRTRMTDSIRQAFSLVSLRSLSTRSSGYRSTGNRSIGIAENHSGSEQYEFDSRHRKDDVEAGSGRSELSASEMVSVKGSEPHSPSTYEAISPRHNA